MNQAPRLRGTEHGVAGAELISRQFVHQWFQLRASALPVTSNFFDIVERHHAREDRAAAESRTIRLPSRFIEFFNHECNAAFEVAKPALYARGVSKSSRDRAQQIY